MRPSEEVDPDVLDAIAGLPDEDLAFTSDQPEEERKPERTAEQTEDESEERETEDEESEGDGAEEKSEEDDDGEGETESGEDESEQPEGDFIEREVNGEVQRISLEDALEKLDKYDALSHDVQSFKTELEARFVDQHAPVLQEALDLRKQWVEKNDQVKKWLAGPQKPDRRMLDSNSEFYNPEAYHAASAEYEERKERWDEHWAKVEQERQQLTLDQQKAADAMAVREAQKLVAKWPDWADTAKQPGLKQAVYDTLDQYGFSPQEADNLVDHRLFLAVRDLAAFQQMKAGKPETAKKRAAPKLIKAKGKAKAQTELRGAAKASHLAKKSKQSGKLEDAADWLATQDF